jgi:death-on-curing protein
MITVKKAEKIHKSLIETFGGAHGIRDVAGLESALSRPFQTFDNAEFYPTILEKAASLLESILINHPLIDGNKRTGYVLVRLFLIQNGFDIHASQEEKYNFIINIASGKSKIEDIAKWLRTYTRKHP